MTLLIAGLRLVHLQGAALIALAAVTATATAQVTPEQQSAIRSNCRSDFMSKCSGVTPGSKDALVCLQKNVASLSPGCKTAVSATIPAPATAKPAQLAPTSAPAAATAAPAVPAAAPPAPAQAQPAVTTAPSPPAATPKPQQAQKPAAAPKPQQAQRPATPPKQSAAALPAAAAPAAALPAPAAPAPSAQQLSAIKSSCKREFSRFCKGAAPGGAEAIACLKRSETKLSPDCRTSLADIGDAVPPSGVTLAPTSQTPNAPIVMTAVIGRSCMRDLLLHCRDTGVGDGQKIACLMARGPKLAVLCQAALKITEPVR